MSASRSVEVARRLAHVTDRAVRIPFTGIRFGLDALLGLLPGGGDAAGAVLSGYVVIVAIREGVSAPTLLRMLGNIAVETLVGVVPVLGDLFDVGWKANVKNVRLLDQHLAAPESVDRASALIAGGTVLGLVAVAGVAIWSTLSILGWIARTVVAVGGG